jgi:hypothetical protein
LADSLQNSCTYDKTSTLRINSLTQFSNNTETTIYIEGLREEVINVSAQLQRVICDGSNLESKLRGIEEYLPSLGSWAVEATYTLNRLQEPHNVKKQAKRLTRS